MFNFVSSVFYLLPVVSSLFYHRKKYVTLEGLAKLCESDPFQCAIMCRNIDEMEGG